MRMIVGLAAALVLLSGSSLAGSVPFCPNPEPGLFIEFGFAIGEEMTEAEENKFYLMRLQAMGIDAMAVERWNGCLRAFVRNVGRNGQHMEYYDPRTLQRVD